MKRRKLHPCPAGGGVDERRRNREVRAQRDREPAEAFQVSAGALRPLLRLGVTSGQLGSRLGTPQQPRPPEERGGEEQRRKRGEDGEHERCLAHAGERAAGCHRRRRPA